MCSCYKLLESVVKNTNTRLLDIDLGLRICEVSLNEKHLPPSTCSSRDKVTQGQIFSWLSLKYNVTDINIPTNLKSQYCEQLIHTVFANQRSCRTNFWSFTHKVTGEWLYCEFLWKGEGYWQRQWESKSLTEQTHFRKFAAVFVLLFRLFLNSFVVQINIHFLHFSVLFRIL